jgi:uncharacterized membrane-anchored protein
LLFFLLAAVFLGQLLVPVSMLLGREAILSRGHEVKVHARPIDPYDPFRGRYVIVNAAPHIPASVKLPSDLSQGDTVYAALKTEDGFARVTNVTTQPPEGSLYLEATFNGGANRQLAFNLDRYYMNEKMAPAAENLVREHLQRADAPAQVYVTLRVLDGDSVITGLFVDGIPIEDLLEP